MRIHPIFSLLVCTAFLAFPFCSDAQQPAPVPPSVSLNELKLVNVEALRLAIDDLTRSFGEQYPNAPQYLARLQALNPDVASLVERVQQGDATASAQAAELLALSRETLLANPLLDFDRLLIIKRGQGQLGLPQNWDSNSTIAMKGYDNEIDLLSLKSPAVDLTPLFRPGAGEFVGDVDLHFDADRMLFSMPGGNGRWQVFELNADGSNLRQLPLIEEADVDNYDACYLLDGNIIFTSTAPFVGVPCVTGSSHVSNLYLLDTPTGNIRRLGFEQDHDWCPTVLNNGRILYLRWEYSDLPHFVSRILFHMNPDGTGQMEYYGSNSYWPNAMFYARPIPNDPSKFVAVVGGHHDNPRMGELVLFDSAKGRHEADGALQRIPGRGKKVEPILLDGLTKDSWPKFLHPFPLSDKYFLVSCKPTPESLWGIYLVDVFDNMTLIKEVDGYALFEPVPLRKTPKPPLIPSKVQPGRADAQVYLSDVYLGPGLAGVPRGTVKQLRLFTYHFAYHGMGGQLNRVGLDGPWDIKRIMGTVPVEPDGSAYFRVPANTPISVQPLDGEGKALQLMRSWMTAMPGEVVSCVGCHDKQNMGPPSKPTIASRRTPSGIAPWYGPTRGFSFEREVQPVLDAYCVKCHDGKDTARPDFRPLPPVHTQAIDVNYNNGTQFTPSYLALRGYLRTPTIESDMHLNAPCEWHADTNPLFQVLMKGHHGVELSPEAWDRLITWIDLNAPAHGTWHEIVGDGPVTNQRDRRREMLKRYANIDEDPEAVGEPAKLPPSTSGILPEISPPPEVPAAASQTPTAPETRTLDLGNGVTLTLAHIPAGEFTMGSVSGDPDEQPATPVAIPAPFWMGTCEITNAQFALFDAAHDSRLEHGDFLHFSEQERGDALNAPNQPVVRVSWERAMAFCQWLSNKTGETFTLPTEAQWEYACRAGTATPLWYGDESANFATSANLADTAYRFVGTYSPWAMPSGAIPPWRHGIETVNDNFKVSAPVATFAANPWGLYDMHGNAAEWTRSLYRPYPYAPADGREDPAGDGKRVVRGGSWAERPYYAHTAHRIAYPAWRRIYNVGFRVVTAIP